MSVGWNWKVDTEGRLLVRLEDGDTLVFSKGSILERVDTLQHAPDYSSSTVVPMEPPNPVESLDDSQY